MLTTAVSLLISAGLLKGWLEKLAPFYAEGSELRKKVLQVCITLTMSKYSHWC